MERIANISRSFTKAEEWDIKQYKAMTPEHRQYIAKTLKERFYGKNCPDVREAENKKL